MFFVLLVIFIVVMLFWALSMSGKSPEAPSSPWVPFIAVLALGIVVFLIGGGVVTIEKIR